MKIWYNPKLKAQARDLRKQGVLSEVLLWEYLKGRNMRGYQFMRQKPVMNYIVDFYCSKLKLVIEIDGESHDGRFLYDIKRQLAIEGWVERNENNPLPPFSKGELPT